MIVLLQADHGIVMEYASQNPDSLLLANTISLPTFMMAQDGADTAQSWDLEHFSRQLHSPLHSARIEEK